MKRFRFLALLLAALVSGCDPASDDDVIIVDPSPATGDCGRAVEILPVVQWPAAPDLAGARVASVVGSCVVINYTWTGCSDQGLPLRLLTDGAVAESSPTQTTATLRFSVNDDITPCAIFENQLDTFDVSPYIGDARPTLLTIVGADTTLFFE